jgi:hypothetical protein
MVNKNEMSELHQQLAKDLESGQWPPLIEIAGERPDYFPTLDQIREFQKRNCDLDELVPGWFEEFGGSIGKSIDRFIRRFRSFR